MAVTALYFLAVPQGISRAARNGDSPPWMAFWPLGRALFRHQMIATPVRSFIAKWCVQGCHILKRARSLVRRTSFDQLGRGPYERGQQSSNMRKPPKDGASACQYASNIKREGGFFQDLMELLKVSS